MRKESRHAEWGRTGTTPPNRKLERMGDEAYLAHDFDE